MKKLTKKERIIRWASEKKTRPISHAITDLNTTEKNFRFYLNRLKRKGFITFTITGRKIQMNLTLNSYYNRRSLVNAR